jgi:glycosyltransferase involved in cell wall biosynthesis
MEFRPFYLAREWMKLGHTVTIVAASCSHVRTHSPAMSDAIMEEDIEGVRYVWLKTPSYHGNGMGRLINMLAFVWRVWRLRNRFAAQFAPDLVIASSTYPLDNVPAQQIARKCKAQLVYEVHDLWPLSPVELGGMSRWHPFVLLMQWAEDFAYRNANRVVSILPCAESHMRERGMAAEKFVYIPNGIDRQEWEQRNAPVPPEHQEILSKLKVAGRFIVGYAGAHGLANALRSLLEAAKKLEDQNITIVLVGQGPMKTVLQEQTVQARLHNVVFLPPVSKDAMPSLLSYFDVCYIGLKRTPLFLFGVSPNKLLDYMMAAKPVIQAIDAGNDLVVAVGCGRSVPPENAAAIARAAKELKVLTPAERHALGQRGKDYVLACHDYRVLASQFLEAVKVHTWDSARTSTPLNNARG